VRLVRGFPLSWWAGRLRHHGSHPAGAHTPSVGYLLVTSLRTQEVWVELDKDWFPSRSSLTSTLNWMNLCCQKMRRGWVPTAKSEIEREQRAHHPWDVACSGFAVATVGKTEELVRGCTDVPACSECAVPRATRACTASPRGGVRCRFPNCRYGCQRYVRGH